MRFRSNKTVAALAMALGLFSARAERYLTTVEAQKVLFPHGEQFEKRITKLGPEQSKEIEKRSGTKPPTSGTSYWLVRDGTSILGVFVLDQVRGKHNIIDYAVAVTPGGSVMGVEILEYREKYGGEIRNRSWRDQFKGKTASDALKLHDDIYNLSGATISCRHVTEGIRRVLATFDLSIRPELVGSGGLPKASSPGRN
jgi:Na+-translocating ferredoxin:NAD+ oxidoreductase RnfG subunit